MKWLLITNALALSAIAAWYSVAGLVAIFAAAALPVIIMGGALEASKLVAVSYLHRHWNETTRLLKYYLICAVAVLMVITSMGIFGFLSKAHLDQAVPIGNVQADLALIDEKIKIQRDNIESARNTLRQMDAQVDQLLARTDTEAGADKASKLRRSQARERDRIIKEINVAQKIIAPLNEERAKIASEVRKVEAEVGPVKYVAALIYGDNPGTDLLEKAIRWVIILLVVVFDPLAVALLLAWHHITHERGIPPTTTPATYEPPEPSPAPKSDEKELVAPNPEPPVPLVMAKEEKAEVTPTPELRISPGVTANCADVATYDGRTYKATTQELL